MTTMPFMGMARRVRHAGALALVLFAAVACSVLPPQPARFNAYEGLMPGGAQPPQAAMRTPIPSAGKSIALVVSSSTERQFNYIEEVLVTLKVAPLHGYSPKAETRGRPAFFVGEIVKKFQSRFARVQLVDNFAAASAGRYDYIAVIDLGIRKPLSMGTEFAYDIDIDLLTPRLERIVHLEGHGRDNNKCPGIECMLATDQRTLDQALGQFYAAFDAAVR